MGNFFTSRVPVVTDTNYNLSLGVYNNIGAPNTDNIPIGPWAIEPGFVEFVNPDDYSCYVVSDSGRVIPRALCLSSWFSFSTGAGMYTYPQPNSRVLIGYSSKQEGFILGFIPCQNYDTENLYLNNRTPDLTDGDIHICTEYGSFIQMCNKGQIINVECDPVCKIEMQSTEHKIFMKSHRVYINTAAGLLQMDTTDDGRTTTVAYFRMKTGDVDNFVKVIIGNTGVSVGDKLQLNTDGSRSSTEVIFALNICNKASITVDTDGNVVTYCKSIQNRVVEDVDNIINGSVTSAVQKGVSTANKGDLKIMATGSLEVAANDKLILSGGQSLEAVSPKTTLASTGSLDITCSGVMTRSSNGAIIDKGTSIQHSAGGAGAIPEITNVTVTDVKAVGIMDTSVSEMEKYNPALASSIPDPISDSTSIASISSDQSSSIPEAQTEEELLEEPAEPPSDPEVKLLAIVNNEYYKQARNGNLCREGTITLYNNENESLGTYRFINGPWGAGAIPLGLYTVSGGERCSESAISVKDVSSGKTSGWKFSVSDVFDERTGSTRSGIKIHPNGGFSMSEEAAIVVDRLASTAYKVAMGLGGTHSLHMCAKGVKTSLCAVGLLQKYPNGNAWQLAALFESNSNFQEITDQFPTKASLVNMPKGAIVVWNRKSGASQYGHTAISLGEGKEASDHVRKIIIDTRNRYGPYRVFFPTGNSVLATGTEGSFAISGTYIALENFYIKLKEILDSNNGSVKMEYKKG